MNHEARKLLLNLYTTALKAVHGKSVVKKHLTQHPIKNPVAVIAIGKAAMAMAQGAYAVLGHQLMMGLVITKSAHGNHSRQSWPFTVVESSHPYPDEHSIYAGQQLIQFIEAIPESVTEVILLISGGTSSLVEYLPQNISVNAINEINHYLLASGYFIEIINRIRKRVSLIKAGRLAHYLSHKKTTVLMISDVPGDDIKVIGSGLTVPHDDSDIELGDILLPANLSELVKQAPPPLLKANNDKLIEHVIIANNRLARVNVIEKLQKLTIPCFDSKNELEGNVMDNARMIVETVRSGKDGIYLWGGETTVNLPENSGKGGRCQALALAAAIELSQDDNIVLLACGSDGTDGPGEDAGAMVDKQTIERGIEEQLNPQTALQQADSGTFLDASGDLIHTGPTGTNVMDLVLVVKGSDQLVKQWVSQIHTHHRSES